MQPMIRATSTIQKIGNGTGNLCFAFRCALFGHEKEKTKHKWYTSNESYDRTHTNHINAKIHPNIAYDHIFMKFVNIVSNREFPIDQHGILCIPFGNFI
jgi:hypothetical protein